MIAEKTSKNMTEGKMNLYKSDLLTIVVLINRKCKLNSYTITLILVALILHAHTSNCNPKYVLYYIL